MTCTIGRTKKALGALPRPVHNLRSIHLRSFTQCNAIVDLICLALNAQLAASDQLMLDLRGNLHKVTTLL
jgi:hypothetical protein